MTSKELELYLLQNIPLTRAMQISILEVTLDGVVVSAPLPPNINHRDTVFGGSASAIAILAAWAFVHTRLLSEGTKSRLVIQRNKMEYDLPIDGTFTAHSSLANPIDWDKFTQTLQRRGRARITILSVLKYQGQDVGHFEGQFVAIKIEDQSDTI